MEVDKNQDTTTKIQAFEYFVHLLIKWYLGVDLNAPLEPEDVEKFNADNDFSKLKLLKLLFLACAESEDREEAYGIFNNFVAMQYGPVEMDVYNNLDKNTSFAFDGNKLKFNEVSDIHRIELIDKIINNLQNKRNKVIKLETWYLVDLTHQYHSWKTAFKFALYHKKRAAKMNNNYLLEDNYLWQ